jgi:hypothetical protein
MSQAQEVKKCMTCGCDDLGNDHHYISDTEKCMSCVEKESAGAGRISGGVGFKLEYNVPDCLGGYAVTKAGTGQVIGCYTTKEHAEEAMKAIAVNEPIVKGEVTDQNLDGFDDPLTFWGASFSPFIHQPKTSEPMVPTYNTPPQHDGEPSVGYGNRSDKHGRSNS